MWPDEYRTNFAGIHDVEYVNLLLPPAILQHIIQFWWRIVTMIGVKKLGSFYNFWPSKLQHTFFIHFKSVCSLGSLVRSSLWPLNDPSRHCNIISSLKVPFEYALESQSPQNSLILNLNRLKIFKIFGN